MSQASRSTGSPAFAGDDEYIRASSRQREAQRLAAAAHVDRGETRRGEAAAAAIALLADLELALARAKLLRSAPVQRLVLDPDGAVLGVDRLGKTVDLPGLSA